VQDEVTGRGRGPADVPADLGTAPRPAGHSRALRPQSGATRGSWPFRSIASP
jgi:hypothetical protein